VTDQAQVITVKTPAEIQLMFEANQIVAGVLGLLRQKIRPGLTTLKLDRWAVEYCRDHDCEPAF
jgi:methionyl aminopeptidase